MEANLEEILFLRKPYKAKFIMVDGLDGAGKGFVVDCIAKYFEEKGFKVYDLRKLEEKMNYLPEFEEIKDYNVFIFKEPTSIGVGKDLREEIFKKHDDRSYNVSTQAMAFSIQREILYKRLVIRALLNMDYVIAERGFITSLVFQPLYSEFKNERPRFRINDIISLEGNKIAMNFMPNYFLITDCNVKEVIRRLNIREKKDKAIYETYEFQKILRDVYLGNKKIFVKGKYTTLKNFLEREGKIYNTKYCLISTEGSLEDTKKRVFEFLDKNK